MIQGLNLSNSKAPVEGKEGAKALSNELANALIADPALAQEQAGFANELENSMKMDELLMAEVSLPKVEGDLAKPATKEGEAAEPQVQSLLSQEMLLGAPFVQLKGLENLNLEQPTSIVSQLPSLQPEAEGVKAKLIDPALTKNVSNLMDPQLALEGEALIEGGIDIQNLKKDQIQTLFAAPLKGEAQRAPAIDLSPSEVDPQLMQFDDFMTQRQMKNSKKFQGGEAYGLPKNTQVKDLENLDLKKIQTVETIGASSTLANSSPSQEFILGMLSESTPANKGMEVATAAGAQKVFNMAQIKSADAQQIINQISDYVVQAKASKEPTLNLKVDHKDFGQMDITVQRSMGTLTNNLENITINIATNSPEVKTLLQQHKAELFTSLNQSGLNLTDFKVESNSSKTGADLNSNSNSHSGSQFAGSEKQFGSESNQRRHEQNRRTELWDLLNEKAA